MSQGGFADGFHDWLARCLGRLIERILPSLHGVQATPRRHQPHRVDPGTQEFPTEFKKQIKGLQSSINDVAAQLDKSQLDAALAQL